MSPAPALTLRTVLSRTPESRAKAWITRLASASGDPLPAASLYAGDHWHVVRSIHEDAVRTKRPVSVWICSAGYGLIPFAGKVAPYAATFAPNHPDSVTCGVGNGEASGARRGWWRALASWAGPAPPAPRTIKELVREHVSSFLLAAASPHYLDAMSDDLQEAAALLGPGRLAVFSAGSDSHPTLGKYLVPCDARLQAVLGGALNSLNVRCLRYAFTDRWKRGLELTALQGIFSRLLRKQPERKAADRRALSDEEVCAFIRKALAKEPGARPTPLLRVLRDSGCACEQGRFSELFRRVEGGAHA